MPPQNHTRLHWLNTGLMLLSCTLAFIFPIQLMIAAYAVLGPAHYLTEIAWLREKSFFTTGRHDVLWLILVSLALYAKDLDPRSPLIWFALGLGLVLAFIGRPGLKAAAIAAVAAGVWLAHRTFGISLFWTMMLPTLIHVYLFTGLFILGGALKERSAPGFVSLAVFAACGAAFFLYQPHGDRYFISDAVRPKMEYFMLIDGTVMARFGMNGFAKTLAVMGFMAYAYTYHYLNWFSKVELIGWHQVGRGRLAAVGVLYVLMLGLFAYDYNWGFAASAYLSLLHVVLEFPLDCRAAAGLISAVPAPYERTLP